MVKFKTFTAAFLAAWGFIVCGAEKKADFSPAKTFTKGGILLYQKYASVYVRRTVPLFSEEKFLRSSAESMLFKKRPSAPQRAPARRRLPSNETINKKEAKTTESAPNLLQVAQKIKGNFSVLPLKKSKKLLKKILQCYIIILLLARCINFNCPNRVLCE